MTRLSSRDMARIIAIAAGYAATAAVGLRLGATVHDTPPLWLPAGIAVAALCIGGIRLWPGVTIGTLLVFVPRGNGALLTTAIAISTTVEAILAAWLLSRFFAFRRDLRRTRDATALLLVCGVLAPAVGAAIGAGAFALTGSLHEPFLREWLEWLLGDAMGAIVFAPVMLAWFASEHDSDPRQLTIEVMAFGIGLTLSTIIALGGFDIVGGDDRAAIFISFPFIVWGALRLGVRSTMTAVALVAAGASVAAAFHTGVFSAPSTDVGTLLQTYLATTTITALLIASSVAERRDASARLVESEQHLSLVFNSSSDTLLLFAVEAPDTYRLVMANRALRDALALHRPTTTRREIAGILMSELITDVLGMPVERITRNNDLFRRVIASKVPYTYENNDWVGAKQISEVTLVPVFDNLGRCTHILRSSRDVTARRAAQDSLRLHDFVVTHAPLGVLMLDAAHHIIFANETACALLARTRDDLLKCHIADVDDQWVTTLADAKHRGRHSAELERVAADGTRHPLELSIAFLDYAGQEISCVFIRDISERRRAETTRRRLEGELFQAQKMEAIGTLAGGIAHDFNNILTAIVGNAEIAQTTLPPSHTGRQDIGEVLRAARRARDLVRQILAFSRKQEAERRSVRIADVIDDVLRLLRATIPSTIEISSDITAPDAQVFGDSTQLHQVLMNLGTNAVHAIGDQHGTITLGESVVVIEPDSARADLSPGRYVCITVSDTGHGMDRATLERVFEPFFTTKDPGVGTGLGLAVVHGIVRNHDGVAQVESNPGSGTTFRLYFPLLPPTETHRIADAAELPLGRGERVLFVDDEPALANVTRRMLERLGYRVVALGSPTEALATVRANPRAFDVVISDLTMPGLTGAQLAAEIRLIRPELPIILSTGYLDRLDPSTMKSLHVREVLLKPYTTEMLGAALQRVLK